MKKSKSDAINKLNELAEQNIIESEARYKRITDGITDYLYTVKVKDGKAVETIHNKACFTVTGYTPQDFQNDPHLWINMVPQEEREYVIGRFLKILSGEVQPPIEHRIICKDGRIRWVVDTTIPRYGDDGKLISYDGVIEIISDRKVAEETLKIRASYLTAIIENQPGLVWLKDLDGKFLITNSAFALSCGKNSHNELLGKTDLDIWPKELAEKYRADDAKVISQKKPLHIEEPIFDMKQVKWFETFKMPILDENGGVIGTTGIARDITERKLAEQTQKEINDRFINLSNSVPAFIAYVNADTLQYEFVNDKFEKSFNIPKEKIIGSHIKNVIGENNYQFALKYINEVREGNTSSYENSFDLVSGKRWIQVNYSPVFDSTGKVISIAVLSYDITERKLAEETIRASEERFRQMFQYSAIGMVLVAPNFNFLQVNDAFCTMLGYNEQELLEKTFQEVTFPEDRELSKELVNSVLTGETETFHFEKRYLKKDGNIIWGFVNASLLRDNNNIPLSLVAQIQDISERMKVEEALKTSEEKFRRAFIVSPDSININRLVDGKFVLINEGFTRIMGYKGDEIIGKLSSELNIWKNIEDRQKLIEGIKKYGTVENLEAEFCAKDGTIKNGLMSATLIELNNEKHIISITRDISERKHVEAELEKYRNHLEDLVKLRTEELNIANQDLMTMVEKEKEFELILQESLDKEKELSEMKSRFISTTSHEFRTPLTSILSSAELMQRYAIQWNNERKNEHLDRIKNAVGYLTKLLDDVLTISKTETGNIHFNPEQIDLYQFVDECAQETRSSISNSHQVIVNYTAERTKFRLDAKLMKFIFYNLLSNAAKYSPPGSTIELKISTLEKQLLIEVIDNGIGIPPEESDKIFESFYRSKNAENIAGTGLGLAIVKRAVDLHNGEIVINSILGKGTTFFVKIPIDSTV